MNIKFTLEYDGTNYHGWQIQKELPTIQGELKRAFELVLPNEQINVIGSGRTDQGVHANGQVASLRLLNDVDLHYQLNYTFFHQNIIHHYILMLEQM